MEFVINVNDEIGVKKMKQLNLSLSVILIFTILFGCETKQEEPKRPNILFAIAISPAISALRIFVLLTIICWDAFIHSKE